MQSEELHQLIRELENISKALSAPQPYTLTGALDWPLLLVIGAGFIALLIYIWRDLKSTIKEHRQEWQDSLDKEETERKRQDDLIWKAMRECKKECCPARQKGG